MGVCNVIPGVYDVNLRSMIYLSSVFTCIIIQLSGYEWNEIYCTYRSIKSEKYCLKRIKVCFIDGYYKQLEYNLEISFIIINISNV